MRLSAIAMGVTLMAGMTLAQQPESPASQKGNTTSQTGKTKSESSQAATQGANPTNTEQAASGSELKTRTFKGTLVGASCAGSASRASASGQSSADRENSANQKAGSTSKGEGTKAEANRSANAGSNCNISSSSGVFALQTKDGHTLPFDAVGNERVKQELSNRKSWANASAAGKPIQATVTGAQTGDSLMVLSIH